jgi:dTDP-glucose 4,6-dehydratase/UDP-glucose 4-epimerase
MKLLIIGSKGFIGSHCASYFIQKNYDVWEADIIEDLISNKYFTIDKINPDFSKIFQQQQFDVCINCSGAANVSDSFERPENDFTLNVINVFKIIEAIRCFNAKCKYITFSSAAIYGNPKVLPIKEDSPVKPISPYGWHKWQSEIICKEYSTLYNISTIILRIFSVYGDRLKKQIFWDVFQKTKTTDRITLFGTGLESRDFIYIDDLMNAINIIIENAKFDGEAINVSSGIETTIKEAVYIFCKNIRSDIEICFNNISKEGDPINWKADIGKLQFYGFQNKYSIESGLELTAKWMQENT